MLQIKHQSLFSTSNRKFWQFLIQQAIILSAKKEV